METTSGIQIVNSVITRPGWKLEATESDRFESGVALDITYPTHQFNRADAPDYPLSIANKIQTTLVVGDLDEMDLVRKLIEKFLAIESHEIRESTRLFPTMWAPFHPHRQDGMERWGDVNGDIMFGRA